MTFAETTCPSTTVDTETHKGEAIARLPRDNACGVLVWNYPNLQSYPDEAVCVMQFAPPSECYTVTFKGNFAPKIVTRDDSSAPFVAISYANSESEVTTPMMRGAHNVKLVYNGAQIYVATLKYHVNAVPCGNDDDWLTVEHHDNDDKTKQNDAPIGVDTDEDEPREISFIVQPGATTYALDEDNNNNNNDDDVDNDNNYGYDDDDNDDDDEAEKKIILNLTQVRQPDGDDTPPDDNDDPSDEPNESDYSVVYEDDDDEEWEARRHHHRLGHYLLIGFAVLCSLCLVRMCIYYLVHRRCVREEQRKKALKQQQQQQGSSQAVPESVQPPVGVPPPPPQYRVWIRADRV